MPWQGVSGPMKYDLIKGVSVRQLHMCMYSVHYCQRRPTPAAAHSRKQHPAACPFLSAVAHPTRADAGCSPISSTFITIFCISVHIYLCGYACASDKFISPPMLWWGLSTFEQNRSNIKPSETMKCSVCREERPLPHNACFYAVNSPFLCAADEVQWGKRVFR